MTDYATALMALQRSGARFVIIGQVAAIAYGSVHSTEDLDFCYERSEDNLKRICDALQELHPRLRGAPEDLPFRLDISTLKSRLHFTFVTDAGDIDILGEVTGIGGYAQVCEGASTRTLFGVECKVASLEKVIASKKAAGRAKDLAALPELEALLEMRRKAGDG